jgi:hypothetical protein
MDIYNNVPNGISFWIKVYEESPGTIILQFQVIAEFYFWYSLYGIVVALRVNSFITHLICETKNFCCAWFNFVVNFKNQLFSNFFLCIVSIIVDFVKEMLNHFFLCMWFILYHFYNVSENIISLLLLKKTVKSFTHFTS